MQVKKNFRPIIIIKRIIFTLIAIGIVGAIVWGFHYGQRKQAPRTFTMALPGQHNAEDTIRQIGYKTVDALQRENRAVLEIANPEGNPPIFTLKLLRPGEWARMSASSQRAVCVYIEGLIGEAQVLVSKYIPRGRENPRYSIIAPNVERNLCKSCWGIADQTGHYVLAGTAAWNSLADRAQVEQYVELLRRESAGR